MIYRPDSRLSFTTFFSNLISRSSCVRELLLPTDPSYSLLVSFGGFSRPDIMNSAQGFALQLQSAPIRGCLLHSAILSLAIVANTYVELFILRSTVTYDLYHSFLFWSAARLATLRRSNWMLATVYADCIPPQFPDLIQTLYSMVYWFHSSTGDSSPRLVMTFDPGLHCRRPHAGATRLYRSTVLPC